jgi:MFS transporter, DHA2 family, multidrug resistance protein
MKRSTEKVDLYGIGFLALGIGSLQVFLDTGERKDWFSSNYIRTSAILCAVGLIALVIRELTTDHPVVDLRVLKNRSFTAGTFLMGMLGFVLYASLVLLPLYLQTLKGYPAYNSGLALSPRGLGALLFTPLAGHLTTKTDPRRLLAVGFVLGSITMFQLAGLNLYAGFWDIFWPQVLQGVALSFLFVPLAALATVRITPEKMGNATSIFNLMRNIGGSVGVATMTTFLSRRSQFHQNHLVADVTPGNPQAVRMLKGLQARFYAQGFDNVDAGRKALAAMYAMVQQHAAMLAFVEAFWIMGIVFLLMLPFLPLMQYIKAKPAAKPVRRHLRPIDISALASRPEEASHVSSEPETEEEIHLLLH